MEILNLKDSVNDLTFQQKSEYISLLSQLTETGDHNYMIDKLSDFCSALPDNHIIYVIFLEENIIGSATVFIEPKIIHSYSSVAHIEDVVVDSSFRGVGVGRLLIQKCIETAKHVNCYKCILNCSTHNVGFYQKNGFEIKSNQMELRFT